jgi:hypothetical protein
VGVHPIPQRIDLAIGIVNNHDRLRVELIDTPPTVAITRQSAATIATPANCLATAAAITRIIAESATALAGLRARESFEAPGGAAW